MIFTKFHFAAEGFRKHNWLVWCEKTTENSRVNEAVKIGRDSLKKKRVMGWEKEEELKKIFSASLKQYRICLFKGQKREMQPLKLACEQRKVKN